MAATTTLKRAIFRTITEDPNYHWPYYRLPTEHTIVDLGALEHDVHRLASAWFKQESHDDVEMVVNKRALHLGNNEWHETKHAPKAR